MGALHFHSYEEKNALMNVNRLKQILTYQMSTFHPLCTLCHLLGSLLEEKLSIFTGLDTDSRNKMALEKLRLTADYSKETYLLYPIVLSMRRY